MVFRDTALWLALPWHLEYSSAAKNPKIHYMTIPWQHAAVTRFGDLAEYTCIKGTGEASPVRGRDWAGFKFAAK